MKFFILAAFIATASADRFCKGILFKDKYYDIEYIKEGVNKLHQLIYNRNDNNLYFTFDQLSKYPSRALAYIDMETKGARLIDGIRNATGIAIDVIRNKIYVGGSDGLFALNGNKIPERLPVYDNIKYMYFKDVLYFVNSRKQAMKFNYGAIEPIPELQGVEVDKLVADDDNNIFFLQGTKVFRVRLGTRAINSHEMYTVNAISTDMYYKPYICASQGVYVYNKYKYAMDKVADMKNLKDLTFNRQNEPIYGVADIIAKLKISEVPCTE